ncbi:DNA-binding protein [bacterium]|nr:MAG: DNA-binding protein [bacterium]
MAEVQWITVEEAARLTNYTRVHVRRLAIAGEVNAQRFGRAWMIDKDSLLVYFNKTQEQGKKRGPKPKTGY